jgi:hypothetical protein
VLLAPFCGHIRVEKTIGVHGFNSRPWTALGMRIYEKSVSFVRPNPKFGDKLVIVWWISISNDDFGYLMPFLSLTLNLWTII